MPPFISASLLPADPVDRQRRRVCLREPDAPFHALLGEWLQRAGYEPVRCEAGAAATRVALVVADLPAPRQGGAASIAALRQRFPGARMLAISGQFMPGMHGVTRAAIELGADAVLAKPFAAETFIAMVQMMLRS